jgi:hypothetical protein
MRFFLCHLSVAVHLVATHVAERKDYVGHRNESGRNVRFLGISFLWSMLTKGLSRAGACGIVRTVVLAHLDVDNYTLNFVPYFAWAGAEIAVSMVCIGIPTLRPLYLKSRGVSSTYGRHGHSAASQLPQFTMCEPVATEPALSTRGVLHSRTDSSPTKPSSVYSPTSSRDGRERFSDVEHGEIGVIWVKNEVHAPHEEYGNWPLRS